ncbi:LamG domain-containing protein [Candidatus Laterigemmans baculatus]|uniref:LamG domain-containing protein n=1 Tax=Candidatus Laterigemmans baculatus TaxID=2770505 RepID=UPI0013D9E646|nr:LamG domain-containing protein [Candidatus Laterigemmans baculatus]
MRTIPTAVLLGTLSCLCFPASQALAELRAGAAIVDVSPVQFPVLINGGMTSRSADKIVTPVHARAIVLDDGQERLAIVVVDSCMMPRQLLDEAKELAASQTEIRPDRMLISATHTHTAPASMGCLGTDLDPEYVPYLRIKLAEAIVAAEANLEPARVGWGKANAEHYTALRRWIRRPDRIAEDPFGNPTVRANMHAGRNWDDVVGESGPEDPDLSLISIQSTKGDPIAVLANFSMHYFGGQPSVSADYFGIFSDGLQQRIAADASKDRPPMVGIMSHGCSGDIYRKDYTLQTPEEIEALSMEGYAQGLLDIAMQAYEKIEYSDDADLKMLETRLDMKYRVPDKQRLQWAQGVVEAMGDRLPKTTEEVYAREQLLLHQWQSTQVVVQALRIGDIAIATTPNETYALTGLKIKLQSPLEQTMVIELANGGDGYIPPPEQHLLGGYNTWAARSAGLEVEAEPRIAEAALALLEQVAGKPRTPYDPGQGPSAEKILAAGPAAYWRLDEFSAPRASDASGNHREGIYEPEVVYFLEGPHSDQFCRDGNVNRAAHFAGGRMRAHLPELDDQYSVSLWIWNGMPADARPVSGWFFSRGPNHGLAPAGEQLGVGGTGEHAGKLIFQQGDGSPTAGRTEIPRWTWAQVTMVREGDEVRVYLNGNEEPEIVATASQTPTAAAKEIFLGGRSDNQANWEGRLDEIALFDRPLRGEEVRALAGPQK